MRFNSRYGFVWQVSSGDAYSSNSLKIKKNTAVIFNNSVFCKRILKHKVHLFDQK